MVSRVTNNNKFIIFDVQYQIIKRSFGAVELNYMLYQTDSLNLYDVQDVVDGLFLQKIIIRVTYINKDCVNM